MSNPVHMPFTVYNDAVALTKIVYYKTKPLKYCACGIERFG